ncbi:MAG: bifunctional DNA primase/polymerase [Patescibacteria group bacterium]|nr:bifunctional DNA primase/polymerase [Patescibacteria group bacterium]
MSKQLLASALWYASAGWYVFPCFETRDGRCTCGKLGCENAGKHPRTERGFHDASTDENTIRAWWRRWPEANIGVATGASALVVVDVDTKNQGDATYEALRAELGSEVFETVTALTPSGGSHLVYVTDGSKVSSGAHVLGQGIDIRADGGYIVVAPSTVNGKEYRWEVGYSPREHKSLMWPDELAAKIVKREFAKPLEDAKKIGAGERDVTLASLAGSMRRRGFDFDEIVGALQVTNFKRCDPPLAIADVDRIAKSICRYQPDEVIGQDLETPQIDIEARSISEVFADIHNRSENSIALPFGVRRLDEGLGGMELGYLTVLGARTGVGKTAVQEHILESAARMGDVLLLSLEMKDTRIAERMAARHESYSVREYREMGRPMEDTSWLDELRLKVVSKTNKIDVDAIGKLVAKHKPQLIAIDHARHIKGWLPKGNRRADLAPAEIMEELSQMAEEYRTHVLLLSQVVRQADGERPSLADLRDSGSVEENADTVIFLHRPFQFGDWTQDGGQGPDDVMEFLVWKSRESGTFTAHTVWNGGRMRVVDLPFGDVYAEAHYKRCCNGDTKKKRGRAA